MSQYFDIFLCFSKFFFHHSWNKAWLLVINIVYANCLTNCQRLRILFYKKNQENLKILKQYSLALSPLFEMKLLSVLVKSPEKKLNISVVHFFTLKLEFSSIILKQLLLKIGPCFYLALDPFELKLFDKFWKSKTFGTILFYN